MLRAIRAPQTGEQSAPTRASGVSRYELLPIIDVTRFCEEMADRPGCRDHDHFTVNCIINVTVQLRGQREWRAMSQSARLPEIFDATSPDSIAAAAAQLEPCFREAYAALTLFVEDYDRFSARGLLPETGSKRWPIVDAWAPDRVLINNEDGVLVRTSSSVTLYTPPPRPTLRPTRPH